MYYCHVFFFVVKYVFIFAFMPLKAKFCELDFTQLLQK